MIRFIIKNKKAHYFIKINKMSLPDGFYGTHLLSFNLELQKNPYNRFNSISITIIGLIFSLERVKLTY